VCLPLLIFPCTIKSRSSLLAPAHPGSPRKRAVKRLCVCVCFDTVGGWVTGRNVQLVRKRIKGQQQTCVHLETAC